MATKKKKMSASTKAKHPVTKKTVQTKSKSGFWNAQFNDNIVYWIIIGITAITTALWVYNLNQQASDTFDSIDHTNTSINSSSTHQAVPKKQAQ